MEDVTDDEEKLNKKIEKEVNEDPMFVKVINLIFS